MGKPEFKLRKKYNGIFFKGKLYRNDDTTLKEALYLQKNHPAGDKLFDIKPTVKVDDDMPLSKMNKEQLQIVATEKGIEFDKETKAELVKLIEAKDNEQNEPLNDDPDNEQNEPLNDEDA